MVKTIEEVKSKIILKFLADRNLLSPNHDRSISAELIPFLEFLKIKEIEEFVCSFGPRVAYVYACNLGPSKATRIEACKDPRYACLYACYVDKRAYPMTREATLESKEWKKQYEIWFGKKRPKRKVKKCQKDIQDKKI
jgi:hypothetical protein